MQWYFYGLRHQPKPWPHTRHLVTAIRRLDRALERAPVGTEGTVEVLLIPHGVRPDHGTFPSWVVWRAMRYPGHNVPAFAERSTLFRLRRQHRTSLPAGAFRVA